MTTIFSHQLNRIIIFAFFCPTYSLPLIQLCPSHQSLTLHNQLSSLSSCLLSLSSPISPPLLASPLPAVLVVTGAGRQLAAASWLSLGLSTWSLFTSPTWRGTLPTTRRYYCLFVCCIWFLPTCSLLQCVCISVVTILEFLTSIFLEK